MPVEISYVRRRMRKLTQDIFHIRDASAQPLSLRRARGLLKIAGNVDNREDVVESAKFTKAASLISRQEKRKKRDFKASLMWRRIFWAHHIHALFPTNFSLCSFSRDLLRKVHAEQLCIYFLSQVPLP